MGVDVDHAGRQHQALRVDGLARRSQIATDGGDAAVLHSDIGVAERAAQAVGDFGVRDEEIEHRSTPVIPTIKRSSHLAGNPATRPGPLEIIAAEPAGHIDRLADEIKARHALGLHGPG